MPTSSPDPHADSQANLPDDGMASRQAADRLSRAVQSLENALGPMVSRVKSLEEAASSRGNFEQDRARLAAQLDQAKADATQRITAAENNLAQQKQTMSSLAQETTKELDSVIGEVLSALGEGE